MSARALCCKLFKIKCLIREEEGYSRKLIISFEMKRIHQINAQIIQTISEKVTIKGLMISGKKNIFIKYH